MKPFLKWAGLYSQLDHRGVRLMLTNSNEPIVRETYDRYGKYHTRVLCGRRSISRRPASRPATANEVLITNFSSG